MQLHTDGKGGQSHLLEGNQRKWGGADTHIRQFRCTLLEEGSLCFSKQYKVFKSTVKWMLAPTGHHFSLLRAFSSRNQIFINVLFELTRLEASLQTHFSSLLWVLPPQRFSVASFTSPQVLDVHPSPLSHHYLVVPLDHVLLTLPLFIQQMEHTRAHYVPAPRKTIIWGWGIHCSLYK